MSELPHISIITPTFNQAETLEHTILSVLEQDYPSIEYIIIDGGSTDGSIDIIKNYAHKLHYWQSDKDEGQSWAINKGFKNSNGQIMAWLNSDDWYEPNTLKVVGEFFVKNPQTEWLGGSVGIYNKNGRLLEMVKQSALTIEQLLNWDHDCKIMQPGIFWTRSLWETAGTKIDERYDCAMDYELWLRFAKISPLTTIDQVLAGALWNKDIKTYRLASRMLAERALAMSANGYFYEARKRLERPLRHAVNLQRGLSFITGNKWYRQWRERHEKKIKFN